MSIMVIYLALNKPKTAQIVINLMNLKKYNSVKELAYQAEFYDLAHFTHRFKDLTGFTPNEFIKTDKHIYLYEKDLIFDDGHKPL